MRVYQYYHLRISVIYDNQFTTTTLEEQMGDGIGNGWKRNCQCLFRWFKAFNINKLHGKSIRDIVVVVVTFVAAINLYNVGHR